MKVVVLCGGMGMRMRDLSDVLPKPLVPIGGRPILWHIMKYYAHFGHRDFVLCLGYKRESFIDFFLHYRVHQGDLTIDLARANALTLHDSAAACDDWRVTLADTGLHTATGARLRRAARHLDEQRFLLTYGDGLGAIDIDQLLDFHCRHGKLATVSAVHPAGRFGEIELLPESLATPSTLVARFAEKPQTSAGYINGGFMVFERDFIERYIDDDADCVLEADALTRCARDGQLAAYCHDGFWQCMDTPREHQVLEQLWDTAQAPWKVWYDPEDSSRLNERARCVVETT